MLRVVMLNAAMLSVIMIRVVTLNVAILSFITLNVVMRNVVGLSVVMLNVLASLQQRDVANCKQNVAPFVSTNFFVFLNNFKLKSVKARLSLTSH
jgi:hypothetical protein